jgi:hypothetical protein
MAKPVKRKRRPDEVESGPGALCPEAQADGVPCTELGRECETCAKARAPKDDDEEILDNW